MRLKAVAEPAPLAIFGTEAIERIPIGARLLGPVLLALFAFGLRARVHR